MQENKRRVVGEKILADTGVEGEVMGKKVGPWEEIKDLGNGKIEMMLFHLVRV